MGKILVILGCGNLGTAILSGVLSSIQSNVNNGENKISNVIACVRQQKSAERIKTVLGPSLLQYVEIRQGTSHQDVVAKGDFIILGCKPYMVHEILRNLEMREALRGKVLISVCAGVTVTQIYELVGRSTCTVIRVMPNVASSVHQSMSVIESSEIPEQDSSLVTWIFSQIGSVTHLPNSQMDTATALCGSGPAFFAVVLESAIDGAVTMGMPRDEATRIAAQSMRGAAELILAGDHPAILKDRVSSPGGCTTKGLLVLEEGAVRGHVARAVREAATAARSLSHPNR
ncbi:Pyrroline-5-carboxylate reductase [Golovinomyces cichoracearum]|uniref:Pyrroline-5-carboxylate reductase n=1 Tax=Golovinomyces cichoracearum TaxID=62708 RepID=A0A420HY85_9PEZI|nr:Pyrroline-5-carboxylate reductase [Golovinomyces cichoracearum]